MGLPSRLQHGARLVALLGAVLALAAVPACTAEVPSGSSSAARPGTQGAASTGVATEPTMQPDDLVDLTVYLRAGEGSTAHLEPVVREVPVTDDLPRRSIELLLAGPQEGEDHLSAPLPTTTTIHELTVEGGTARIDLSGAVIRDASSVGASPGNEILALGALANTLTEFPSIERVVVAVDGEDGESIEAFWGGWGLPDVLVRDESLVGAAPADAQGVADLSRFSMEAQEVGSSDASPVRIESVRARDRISHTPFVVELANPHDATAPPKIPPVRVRMVGDRLTVFVSGVVNAEETAAGLRAELDPEIFTALHAEPDAASRTVRLVIEPTDAREFWLHSLTNPTRIVLDVKK